MTSIFAFSASQCGKAVSLAQYKNYVTVVVNTASRCGFTTSNVSTLREIQDLYKGQKLTVLAFPCGQFAKQEPLSNDELEQWKQSLDINFPVFDKIEVKGPGADPLFAMLGQSLGAPRWNFTKYVCDRDGVPREKLDPTCSLSALKEAVEKHL